MLVGLLACVLGGDLVVAAASREVFVAEAQAVVMRSLWLFAGISRCRRASAGMPGCARSAPIVLPLEIVSRQRETSQDAPGERAEGRGVPGATWRYGRTGARSLQSVGWTPSPVKSLRRVHAPRFTCKEAGLPHATLRRRRSRRCRRRNQGRSPEGTLAAQRRFTGRGTDRPVGRRDFPANAASPRKGLGMRPSRARSLTVRIRCRARFTAGVPSPPPAPSAQSPSGVGHQQLPHRFEVE
jgi:hypothetical protein